MKTACLPESKRALEKALEGLMCFAFKAPMHGAFSQAWPWHIACGPSTHTTWRK